MKKFLDTCRRLLSIALNLFVLCAEPIALPLSWEMGQAQIFTYYTEDSNIFAAAVCTLVALWQLRCIFTGGELPVWLKKLKFMATSCLLLTFMTVVLVLAPMVGEGGLYLLLCTSSARYHHLLNPVLVFVSFVCLEREPRLPARNIPLALVPTAIYGSIALWANYQRLWTGPYPFLLVYEQTPRQTVLWCAGILAGNLICAALVWWLGGNSRKRR